MTVSVCGFRAGPQDNWLITQHISRMVNGTALQQVTMQVDFIMNTCDIDNNCRRAFAIHKYETSTINATAARNLSNYEFVGRIVPRDGSGTVRENGSVNINFATEATGFYLGIQDVSSCLVIHRVLVFYYVCPAVTSDLIAHPETIAPIIGGSAPTDQVVGQCVEGTQPENEVEPRLTCSPMGIWSVNLRSGCVCGSGFQSSSDGRSCVGMFSVCLLSSLSLSFTSPFPHCAACGAGTYETDGTCLPCPANSNSTQPRLSECTCFEGYYRAVGEPPEMACTRKSHVVVLESRACSVVSCMVWWGRIRSGFYGSGRTSNVLSYLNKSTDDVALMTW